MTKTEARQNLRRLMNKTGWGPKKLSENSGVSHNEVEKFFYDKSTYVKTAVYFKLQDALLDALKEKTSKS